MLKSNAARVAIAHNPTISEAGIGAAVVSAVEAVHSMGPHSKDMAAAMLQGTVEAGVLVTPADTFKSTEACAPGESCLFANGRKVGAPTDAADVAAALQAEAEMGAKLADVIRSDDAFERAAAVASARPYVGRRAAEPRSDVEGLVEDMLEANADIGKLVLDAPSRVRGPAPEATALLDPLSEAAQRAAPVLLALRDVLGLRVKLVLTPDPELREMPLQKYYRFALDADAVGAASPKARFAGLPRPQVLTLRVDTPEAWDAQMAVAEEDPDNLRCDGACEETAKIIYELKSLVVMGQCYDVVDSRPPNGLQIQLDGTRGRAEFIFLSRDIAPPTEYPRRGRGAAAPFRSSAREVVFQPSPPPRNIGAWCERSYFSRHRRRGISELGARDRISAVTAAAEYPRPGRGGAATFLRGSRPTDITTSQAPARRRTRS